MAEQTASKAKLAQYLAEAHAKEKQLETDLQAHIAMTTRKTYKKRLQDHLKETRNHARMVERRAKALGGGGLIQSAAGTVTEAAGRAKALARGPLHTVRGTSEAELQLKNARTEYSEEFHEIAMYTSIETAAEAVNDKDTAKLAREIRREEERMAKFLERQIPILTKAAVQEEVPAAERRTSGGRRRRSTRRRSSGSSHSGGSSRSRSGGSRSGGSRSGSRSGSRRSGGSSRSRSGSSSRSGGSRSGGSRRTGSSSRSRSGGSSRSSGRSRSSGSSSARSRRSSS